MCVCVCVCSSETVSGQSLYFQMQMCCLMLLCWPSVACMHVFEQSCLMHIWCSITHSHSICEIESCCCMCSRHVMTTCCPPSCPKIRFANFASLNVFVSATVLNNHVDKTSSQIPPGAKGNCTSLQPCDNNFARQKWAQTSIGKCLGNSEATKRLTRKTAMIGSVLKTCMPHFFAIWEYVRCDQKFFKCADSGTRRSCLDGLANQCHVIIDKCNDVITCKDVFSLQTSADQMLMLVVEKNQIALV